MDYTQALRQVEMDAYNHYEYNSTRVLEILVAAMEDYKHVKRFNLGHANKIKDELKDSPIFSSMRIEKSDYRDTYDLTWYYNENKWSDYVRGPSRRMSYDRITLSKDELSGQAILDRMKEKVAGYIKHKSAAPDIEAYRAFYKELADLNKKHACSERAFYVLRNA